MRSGCTDPQKTDAAPWLWSGPHVGRPVRTASLRKTGGAWEGRGPRLMSMRRRRHPPTTHHASFIAYGTLPFADVRRKAYNRNTETPTPTRPQPRHNSAMATKWRWHTTPIVSHAPHSGTRPHFVHPSSRSPSPTHRARRSSAKGDTPVTPHTMCGS